MNDFDHEARAQVARQTDDWARVVGAYYAALDADVPHEDYETVDDTRQGLDDLPMHVQPKVALEVMLGQSPTVWLTIALDDEGAVESVVLAGTDGWQTVKRSLSEQDDAILWRYAAEQAERYVDSHKVGYFRG